MGRKERAALIYDRRSNWVLKQLDEMCLNKDPIVVEIGVWRGAFGSAVLRKSDKVQWIGIDPFVPYTDGMRAGGMFGKGGRGGFPAIRKRALSEIAPFADRYQLIEMTSEEAVPFVPDNVDLIFNDGDHTYDMITNEFNWYLPKLHKKGIFSGHDYVLPEVKKAVDDYVREMGKDLAIERFERTQVWWFYK